MNKPWVRRIDQAVISGVIAGLADSLNISANSLRFIALILLFSSFGSVIVVYIILAIVLPASDATSGVTQTAQSDKIKFQKKDDEDIYAFDPDDYKW